jgi:hypothetical protein
VGALKTSRHLVVIVRSGIVKEKIAMADRQSRGAFEEMHVDSFIAGLPCHPIISHKKVASRGFEK